MRSTLKILIPVAFGLAVVAAVIAFDNKVSSPKSADVDPVQATGNVEDTAQLLLQDDAAEAAIMSEADKDVDVLDEDAADAANVSGAYDENAL